MSSSASLIGAWSSVAAPPPALTVSQWADLRRRLPARSAARGGRWRTASVQYLAGIMDAVHEVGVDTIAVRKSHQCGGSEALHNILGYHIEYDPCAMLLVHPTESVAEAWSKERLADMLRSTPELNAAVYDKRQSGVDVDGESTLTLKMFAGGYLALGGANTPNTFARWSVRLAMGDDVDRFPPVVGDEGDPADLLQNRTTSFYDALSIFVSTPTLKHGRIDTLYERSDQRRYFVTCLECGRQDWITWSDPKHFRVVFDDRNPDSARLECPTEEFGGCGAPAFEPDRRAMVGTGHWRPTAETKQKGLVGFHLPAMVSTLGNVTLATLVDKWLGARARGKESLRVFINTSLAEGWEDHGVRVESHTLLEKREDYGQGIEIPAGAVAITAGVDVQSDYFQIQVQAWGLAAERWVIGWHTVPGDPKKAETRQALLEALGRKYAHALGLDLPIHAVCVDSGYATEEIYDFVLAYQARRIFATKGFGGKSGEPIVGKPSEKRYGRSPRPVRLYPINVDDAKSDVLSSIQVLTPGPGKMHFPQLVDEEYFAQLCAEHKETRYNKSRVATHTVWVQDRDRNEGLDTAVLCLAAYRLLNPNIRQMMESLTAAAAAAKPAPETAAQTSAQPAQPSDPPAPPERRLSRSKYLLS